MDACMPRFTLLPPSSATRSIEAVTQFEYAAHLM